MITHNVTVPTDLLKFEDLTKILATYCDKKQIDFVERAYNFAQMAHVRNQALHLLFAVPFRVSLNKTVYA